MEERHKRILMKQNPLWQNRKFIVPEFKRNRFETIQRYLKYKQVIGLVGLRRVGKTVLLKQIINKLSHHIDNKNICYISFDDKDFQKYETVEELINYFLEFSDKNKKRYLFLDEIQKISNWTDLLKTFYEIEINLKIVISGSSSLELKKYKETLAGRIITFYLPIFSFSEFVRYKKLEYKINSKNLFREYDFKFLEKKEKYLELFNEYLIKGAFPELLDITDEEFIKKYLKESVIDKVVADLSKQIEPKRENTIYELLRIFSKSTSGLFEITNLANILNLNRNFISRYIGLLEKTFLIKISYNFTKSVVKQVRTSKKVYIAHSSIPISLLDYPLDILNIESYEVGNLVESVLVNHLEKISFWRTPQKDEVDIIIKKNKKILPIEVKYRNQITKKDLKALIKFMKKFKTNESILITKDLFKKEDNILFIPAWLFLLIENL